MNKQRFYDLLKFVTFVICFAGIPLGMMIFGYFHTKNVNRENFVKNLTSNISAFYTKLTPFADQQKFWWYLFNSHIVENLDPNKPVWENMKNYSERFFEEDRKSVSENMKKFAGIFSELNKKYDFEYLVYHPQRGMIASLSADTLRGTIEEKRLALAYCWYYEGSMVHGFEPTEEMEKAAGVVFGPQFYPGHMDFCQPDFPYPSLCWADSTYARKPFWAIVWKQCLVMAFLKQESLEDTKCMIPYLENAHKEIGYNVDFVIIDENNKNNWFSDLSETERPEITEAYKDYVKNRSLKIESKNFIVFPKFMRPGVTVLGYLKKSDITHNSYDYWIYLFVLTTLLALSVVVYGWQILINKKLDKLSLKWKLGFLFFFANGLPLLVLAYIGNDFLKQSRDNYIQSLIKEGTAFLQDFDEKYELEFARCLIKKEKIKNSVFTADRDKPMDNIDLDKFYNIVPAEISFISFISSGSQILIKNKDGFFDQNDLKSSDRKSSTKKSSKKNNYSIRLDKNTKLQVQFAEVLGHYFLDQVNEEPIDEKTAAEIEMLIESTMRRRPENFIFEIFTRCGDFMELGSSHKHHLSLSDLFSYGGHKKYDYYMVMALSREDFQYNYLTRAIPAANRNELGLRVIVCSASNDFIPQYEADETLLSLTKRFNTYPTKEAIVVNHKGVDYIAMGFECKHIEGNKIIGLYPLDIIDEHVKARRNDIILISVLSLLITLALSFAIIKAFLTPLYEITAGAKAIEQKNFEYRLPELGRDEFGAMGKIFNDVMVDFDELSVAGTIQEQLLPSAPIETGRFSLYGKSVAMGALGGDYFDFIELEDNKFCVALGDVAGHGVGSSLIMAMAKAALIQLDDLWKEPLKIITRLHEMIYMSKTKNQRKIMTFQYMYVDGNSGEALYSNAGGCSPFIIRKNSGTVEELKLPGAVLGAFKKGKFSEANVNFETGDAIVFYTDGIVECKNKNGEMLGYDNLKLLLQRCWDSDSETFYKKIYKEYLDYIGSEDNAGDDLTMIVMVFNEAKPEEEHTAGEDEVNG